MRQSVNNDGEFQGVTLSQLQEENFVRFSGLSVRFLAVIVFAYIACAAVPTVRVDAQVLGGVACNSQGTSNTKCVASGSGRCPQKVRRCFEKTTKTRVKVCNVRTGANRCTKPACSPDKDDITSRSCERVAGSRG